MPKYDMSKAEKTDYDSTIGELTPDPLKVDEAKDKDYTYQNMEWEKQWSYYNNIPELKAALTMKAVWTVGKGYKVDTSTEVLLGHVHGWGKDTFSDILFNQYLVSVLAGDSYAEIIEDPVKNVLLNIKPMNPGSIRINFTKKGIIKGYDEMRDGKVKRTFKPEQIFHLSHNRLANQCHGTPIITGLQKTIDAEYENFDDMRKIAHRGAKPFIIWKLKTDKVSKIASIKALIAEARKNTDDLFIPDDDDVISFEIMQVDVPPSLITWRAEIRNKFFRALGIPLLLFGSSQTTESGGKMEYLAHETIFQHNQKYVEDQAWIQLNIRLDLIPPVSLIENLQTDEAKDANQGLELQPSDVTPGGAI